MNYDKNLENIVKALRDTGANIEIEPMTVFVSSPTTSTAKLTNTCSPAPVTSTKEYVDSLCRVPSTNKKTATPPKRDKKVMNGRIQNVIFNAPATIVFWTDGSKTVVKCENEEYDPEKGLAMAIVKKWFGNNCGYYYDVFKEWCPKGEENGKK